MRQRYQTPLPWSWFTQRRGYRWFMAREATSVFLAGYLVYLIVWMYRLGQGPEEFAAAIDGSRHPLTVAMHVVALMAALFHSITWFNLTPKIMPIYIGEDRIPDFWAAILMGYLPWTVLSVIILWGIGSYTGG